jgi:hypothetical protein
MTFAAGSVMAGLGFLVVLFLPELPLRSTLPADPKDAAE